jgi:hypothetical protein
MKREKLLTSLKKAYIEMLYYWALGKRIKAYKMEMKAIRLELKLKESEESQRRISEPSSKA